MYKVKSFFTLSLATFFIISQTNASMWGPPERCFYQSKSGVFTLEIIPAKREKEFTANKKPDIPPKAKLYASILSPFDKVEKPSLIDIKNEQTNHLPDYMTLLCEIPLINEYSPTWASVDDTGRTIVTMGNWYSGTGRVTNNQALVFYNREGLLKKYTLSDLLGNSQEELEVVEKLKSLKDTQKTKVTPDPELAIQISKLQKEVNLYPNYYRNLKFHSFHLEEWRDYHFKKFLASKFILWLEPCEKWFAFDLVTGNQISITHDELVNLNKELDAKWPDRPSARRPE